MFIRLGPMLYRQIVGIPMGTNCVPLVTERLFSKFYIRRTELTVKCNICLKTLLQQGISEPVYHGDLVYTLKRTVGNSEYDQQIQQ